MRVILEVSIQSRTGMDSGRCVSLGRQAVSNRITHGNLTDHVREKGASPRFATAGQIAATGTLGPLSHWGWIHTSRRVCLPSQTGNWVSELSGLFRALLGRSGSGARWSSNKRRVSPSRLQPCINCSQPSLLCWVSHRLESSTAGLSLPNPCPCATRPAVFAWCSGVCPLPF